MRTLILSDLKNSFAAWSGLLLIAVAAGCIGEFAALLMFNASRVGDEALSFMLSNAASMVIVFSGIAIIPTLVLASGLYVSEKRKTYALWRLGYLSEGRIRAIIFAQILLISIAGAAAGILIMGALFKSAFSFVFSSRIALLNTSLAVSVRNAPMVCIAIQALFLIGSFSQICEASRLSPIEVLKGDQSSPRSNLGSIVMSGLFVLVLYIMFRIMKDSSFEVSSMIAMLIPIVVTLLLSVSCKKVLPLMLQLWTMPIRGSLLILARNRALYDICRSVSTEAPIMILVGLATGMYSALGVLESYADVLDIGYGSGFEVDLTLSLLMFGGPMILGIISAVVATMVSSRTRGDESSYLMLLGVSRTRIVLCVICEALMHVINALLCGLIGGVVSAALACAGMGMNSSFVLRVFPALVIAGSGFAVVALSMLVPTFLSFRPSFLSRIDRL